MELSEEEKTRLNSLRQVASFIERIVYANAIKPGKIVVDPAVKSGEPDLVIRIHPADLRHLMFGIDIERR